MLWIGRGTPSNSGLFWVEKMCLKKNIDVSEFVVSVVICILSKQQRYFAPPLSKTFPNQQNRLHLEYKPHHQIAKSPPSPSLEQVSPSTWTASFDRVLYRGGYFLSRDQYANATYLKLVAWVRWFVLLILFVGWLVSSYL